MDSKEEHVFGRFAAMAARLAGNPTSFVIAVGLLIGWLIFGPLLDYHPAWLQFFGIGTGIFTFLMVFLLQNTHNRSTEALQLKLDELLFVVKNARKDLIDSEALDESELDVYKSDFEKIGEEARRKGKE